MKDVSLYLIARRFRRRIKSKEKKRERNRVKEKELFLYRIIRYRGRLIKDINESLYAFMPLHFLYLITCENSPFYYKKLENKNTQSLCRLQIPKKFSILSNPEPSYKVLKQIVEAIAFQNCNKLHLDYKDCEFCDLETQVFLDSILKSFDRYAKMCNRIKLSHFVSIKEVGGRNIHKESLQRMINSVGSPVELINRQIHFKGVEAFRLRHVDSSDVTKLKFEGQKEIDSTDLICYVENCLRRFNKTLTQDAKMSLGTILGEIISNAEEHSTLHNRYLIGYMEETSKEQSHYGILNIVIMNTGKTIYERFKYPDKDENINYECVNKMQELSDKFTKKGFFSINTFTEENLWTLYSLQGGVSIVPKDIRKRGSGTISFIKSFFSLKGSTKVDNVSRMSIISGNTRIDFDGSYQISEIRDINNHKLERMTFNQTNSLYDKPDSKYVYTTKYYFPGTLISAQLLINDSDVEKI